MKNLEKLIEKCEAQIKRKKEHRDNYKKGAHPEIANRIGAEIDALEFRLSELKAAIAAHRAELEGLRDEMAQDAEIARNVLSDPLSTTAVEKGRVEGKAAVLGYWSQRLAEYLKGDPK
jgi:predicted RNase H-like nuclease (RuvC/YqgF family)